MLMDKRKDNLTDLAEQLADSQESGTSDTYQVFNSDGELVTLSREDIEKIVQSTVKDQVEAIGKLIVSEVERKLREKGLYK
jgi:hypothetical protein